MTTLASLPYTTNPFAIATDGTNVYWTERGSQSDPHSTTPCDGEVMKLPVGGGTPAVLAPHQCGASVMVIDSENAYYFAETPSQGFIDKGNIMKVPLGGGTPTSLYAADQFAIVGMAVDGTGVYLSLGTAGGWSVAMVPLNGGALSNLVPTQLPTATARGFDGSGGIAVDSSAIYWSGNCISLSQAARCLFKAPLNGASQPQTLVTQPAGAPAFIAIDAFDVYWTDDDASLKSMPIEGGPTTTLVSGAFSASGDGTGWPGWPSFVLDGKNAYLAANLPESVQSVPLQGGTAVTLATSQPSAPSAVAVDGASVYWLNLGDPTDTVMKVTKSDGISTGGSGGTSGADGGAGGRSDAGPGDGGGIGNRCANAVGTWTATTPSDGTTAYVIAFQISAQVAASGGNVQITWSAPSVNAFTGIGSFSSSNCSLSESYTSFCAAWASAGNATLCGDIGVGGVDVCAQGNAMTATFDSPTLTWLDAQKCTKNGNCGFCSPLPDVSFVKGP